jgi:hypothetical protein
VNDFIVDDTVVELYAAGSAHLVGLVTADGQPFATRGWGISFAPDRRTATVLIAGPEIGRLGYPDDDPTGSTMAMTCTHVATLASAQLKGPIRAVRPTDPDDLALAEEYCDAFFTAVLEVDFIARELMERLRPDVLVACEFEIVEAYDQTPGPGAGRVLGTPVP